MGEVYKNIQKLIDAHPDSVHLLFKAKGIKAPVSPQSLVNAYIVYGDEVIRPLVEAELMQSSYDDNAKTTTTTTSDKSSVWDKIANLLNSGAVLTNQVNQLVNPGKVQPLQTTQQQQQVTDTAAIEAYKKAEAEKNAKTLLYIAIAVILVIIIAIIIVKRSK